MYRTFIPACVAILTVSGCGESGSPVSTQESEETEVVVVGTHHLLTDMPRGNSPGHLRALLDRINPDIIAIEAATNVESPLSTAPNEAQQVTIPWAREREIPVVAVGYLDPAYGRKVKAMMKSLESTGMLPAYHEAVSRLEEQADRIGTSMQAINGIAFQQAWRDFHQEIHRMNGGETPWEQWNSRVVQKIQRLCEDNPGKRIAVVFGASHLYSFADLLTGRPGTNFRTAESVLPLPRTSVDLHTDRLDFLRALRPLNLDVVSEEQLEHSHRMLQFIRGLPGLEYEYDLFRAKYEMHTGDFREAVTIFDRVAAAAGDQISQFDDYHRLADGARIGAIMSLAKAGRSTNAVERIQRLLSDTTINPQVREFADSLLNQLTGVQISSTASRK